MRDRIGSSIAAIVVILAFVFLVREMRSYFVDVPYWDEWSMVDLVAKRLEGSLTAADLWRLHNEHRPFFPRLLIVNLAALTHWDFWTECVANLVLGVLCLGGVSLTFSRVRHAAPGFARMAAVGAGGVVLFSMNQWENWLWGWQIQVFLNLAAVSAGFLLLTIAGRWAMAAAAGCGVVATCSFANGLLFWPVGLVSLLLAHAERWKLVVWTLVWLCCWAAYFSGFQWPVIEGGSTRHAAVDVVARLGEFIGSPVMNYRPRAALAVVGLAALIGALTLAIAIGKDRASKRSASPLIAWVLYGAGSGVALVLGRAAFHDGVPSKYVSFANLFWLGLLGLTLVAASRRVTHPRRALQWTLAFLLCALVTLTAQEARPRYVLRKSTLERAKVALFDGQELALLRRFFPVAEHVRDQLAVLRAHQLAFFRCDRSPAADDWRHVASAFDSRPPLDRAVIVSNDWALACLEQARGKSARAVRMLSAGGSAQRAANLARQEGPTVMVTGGDAGAIAAAAWMRQFFPVLRTPAGIATLFYYPDRITYLRQFAERRELTRDEELLWSGDILTGAAQERLLLDGWSERESDRRGPFRWATGARASIYVPVVARRPSRLTLTVASLPTIHPTLRLRVNGEIAGESVLSATWLDLVYDLTRFRLADGANLLELEFSAAGEPAKIWPGSGDTRRLAACFRRLSVD